MAKITTKTKDRGAKNIEKEIKKLEKNPGVKVGYPAERAATNEKHKESKKFVTVLEIAIWNEFGTINAPERSFVRASFDANQKKYLRLNKRLVKNIMAGKATVEKALDILGETILNDIKTFLVENKVEPPTTMATIMARKGSSENAKTLIDTAQLMNSLTFRKVNN